MNNRARHTVVAWVVWTSLWTLQSLSDGLAVVSLAVAVAWVWHGRDDCGSGQSRSEE